MVILVTRRGDHRPAAMNGDRFMRQSLGISMAIGALASLSACGPSAENGDVPAEGGEVEQVTVAEPAPANEAIEVCDGDGNRYASEAEAEAAGLDRAEYGATYCSKYLAPKMHPSWDADGDGVNDCENDGTCDDSVDYTQPRPDA